MKILFDLMRAVKAGEELKRPATWSNAQSLTNAVATILTVLVGGCKLMGYEIPISDDDLFKLAGGVAIVLGVGNSVVSVATTKDAGFK